MKRKTIYFLLKATELDNGGLIVMWSDHKSEKNENLKRIAKREILYIMHKC